MKQSEIEDIMVIIFSLAGGLVFAGLGYSVGGIGGMIFAVIPGLIVGGYIGIIIRIIIGEMPRLILFGVFLLIILMIIKLWGVRF